MSMTSAASVTLLAFALIQSYATRTRNDCTPMSVHATMAECRELSRFDFSGVELDRLDKETGLWERI